MVGSIKKKNIIKVYMLVCTFGVLFTVNITACGAGSNEGVVGSASFVIILKYRPDMYRAGVHSADISTVLRRTYAHTVADYLCSLFVKCLFIHKYVC